MDKKKRIKELEQEISNYKRILEKTKDEGERSYITEQIEGYETEIAELNKKPTHNNDLDFDFSMKVGDKTKKAKAKGKSIADEISSWF